MAGFSIDVADVSTPASDCSSFPMIYNMHSQPGSSISSGGQWDGAVEGSQNFTEYSNQGDMASDSDYTYKMEPQPAQQYTPAQPKWNGGLATPESIGSAAMRRSLSRSSAGSFQSRAMRPSKTRPRIHTALSFQSAHSSQSAPSVPSASSIPSAQAVPASYGLASYVDGSAGALPGYFPTSAASHLTHTQQYLAGYPHGLGGASFSSALAYGMPALGAPYQQQYQSPHIDPVCTQMGLDFDTSAAPSVCSQAWNSASNSRHSSPDAADEDIWQMPALVSSPVESHGSSSSSFLPHMGTDQGSNISSSTSDSGSSNGDGRRLSHAHSQDGHLDEEFTLSPATTALQQKRSNSESSDSARDHFLYKNAACGDDGLYHCPWEGKSQCNHKPEKLKCNYDKFVDSHLKPYRCKHNSCENARFSSTACLLRHEREAHAMHGHGDKPYLCPYPGCDRAQPGFGFPRQWNLKDHMRRVHRDDGTQQSQMAASSAAAAAAAVQIESIPVVSSSSAVSKNRKRKKDSLSSSAGVSSAASSRKSSASKGSAGSRAAASAMAEAAEAARAAQLAQAQAQAQAEAYAAAEAEKARAQMEEWTQYRSTLLGLVSAGLESPNDPKVQNQLQMVQMQVDHLNQIAAACFMTQEPATSYMHFAQQSG